MSILTGTSVTVGIHTSQEVTDDKFVKDVERTVANYGELSTPLFRYFTRLQGRVKPAIQPIYSWQENQLEYGLFTATLANAGAGVAQTITVDYPALVVGDTLLETSLNQQMIVKVVNSRNATSSNVDVVRIPLAEATTAVVDAELISLGTTIVEKGFAPEAIGTQPKEISNICGFQAGSAAISWTTMQSETYWGDVWEYDKKKLMEQYLKDMERTCLFSVYTAEANFAQVGALGSATNKLRRTRGIIEHLSTNLDTYTPPITVSLINAFCRDFVFNPKYAGSNTKLVLCGRDVLSGIAEDLQDKIRIYGAGQTPYGIDVNVYYVYGTRKLIFVEESEFHEPTKYRGGMLFLDPNKLFLKQLGSNFVNIAHTKNPQQFADQISVFSSVGTIVEMEQAHALFTT